MKPKEIFFKILRFSGVVFLFREVIQRNRVTIIMYHDIPKKIADKNFKYLSRHYNIISLNELKNWYEDSKKNRLPKKPMIITFDDGHVGNYDLLEVFKKYKTPVTIFLCSHIINTNRHYWFTYKKPSLDVEGLKKLANKERLKKLQSLGFSNELDFTEPQAISKSQLKEMSEIVNFQAHTKFHPCLTMCNDEELYEELGMSKEYLKNEYDLNINSIAYPNGNYDSRTIDVVRELGYNLGLTCENGYNSMNTNTFKLRRFSTNDTASQDEFIIRASGIYGSFIGFYKSLMFKS